MGREELKSPHAFRLRRRKQLGRFSTTVCFRSVFPDKYSDMAITKEDGVLPLTVHDLGAEDLCSNPDFVTDVPCKLEMIFHNFGFVLGF